MSDVYICGVCLNTTMHHKNSHVVDCRLDQIKYLSERYVLMLFTLPFRILGMLPGQFAQVRIDGAENTFLRRPISICFVPSPTEIWLLVQVVGEGTKKLASLQAGSIVNMVLPLGKSFSIPMDRRRPLLVGGGVGVAPMLFLGKQLMDTGLYDNSSIHFLLGARSKSDLVLLEEFEKYGTVHCTTEDGSYGTKGYVTQHPILQNQSFDQVYTCGPKPMMQAVARYAAEKEIDCEVSLENLMACGIGACLCCVEDTTEGHLCTCTEGPVFNTKRLKW